LFEFLTKGAISETGFDSPHELEITILAPTKDPVKPMWGPRVLADRAPKSSSILYSSLEFISGLGVRLHIANPSLLDFVKRQALGATYVLSVCTNLGSWHKLALWKESMPLPTNPVSGRSRLRPAHPLNEFQLDGLYTRSFGRLRVLLQVYFQLTLGIDMANASLEHLVGGDIAKAVRGIVELSVRQDVYGHL